MDEELVKDFLKILSAMWIFMVIFAVITLTTGCDSGWTVCGWEVK